jgi:hypothetical protein
LPKLNQHQSFQHLRDGQLRHMATHLIKTHYLCTDVDVTFLREPNKLHHHYPRTLTIGGEAFKGSHRAENAAAVLVNRTWLEDTYVTMMECGTDFDHASCGGNLKMDQLSVEFKSKAYWVDSENKSIMHWHGPQSLDTCSECLSETVKIGQFSSSNGCKIEMQL